MNFHQLLEKIFTDYDQTHYDILCDVLMTSEQHANAILAKYDTSEITQEELDRLKKLIVDREVGEYLVFVERHKDVLNGNMSDKEKFRVLMERCDNPSLTERERTLLQKRILRNIYDNEVTKILQNLVDDLKKKQ
jgi:predicted transcriptional regulator